MTAFGKKFLSAFIEVTSEEKPVDVKRPENPISPAAIDNRKALETGNTKFVQYFDKLLSEANRPGPDYYEFSKMVDAMNAIADEKARFCAAFAGLTVQGLDKNKLLSTATVYLTLLDNDATNFHSSIDSALEEKVFSKQKEMEVKSCRIEELTGEITDLHNKISLLKAEINENQEKIEASTSGYRTEGQKMKNRILLHIQKIKEHIR